MTTPSPEQIQQIAQKQDEKAKAIKAAKSASRKAEEEEAAKLIQVSSAFLHLESLKLPVNSRATFDLHRVPH